jgi:hypothetical protein
VQFAVPYDTVAVNVKFVVPAGIEFIDEVKEVDAFGIPTAGEEVHKKDVLAFIVIGVDSVVETGT